jgi:intracellular septation protein A
MISAISALLLIAVLAIVTFLSVHSPLKDDIAWLLYVARRWMAGRELYVDVVEVNPPLIIWISALPLQIARLLNVDPQFVVMPLFIAGVLSCAYWSARLLRPRGGLFAQTMPVFAAIGSTLLILPAVDLGQREHLLVAAFLPYLVLFTRSLDRAPPPVLASVVAGLLAGLGCALKPRYAGVFAVLEILALTRGLRPWRVMPLAAAATLFSYAGLVAIVCPAYVQRAVPMALALYGATDASFLSLLSDTAVMLAGEVVAITLLWLRRRSLPDYNLMLVLVVFAATSTIVCFVDGKNWYYHRLPATVSTVLALLLWTATELTQRRGRLPLPLLTAVATLTLFCAASIQRLEPEAIEAMAPAPTAVDRLEQILRTEHAKTYVAFSEWIALGFPVVNETGVSWASRFDSMWALKGEVWRARFDPAADREWPIARWVAHDFIAGCPDIAVVDTRETTKYISVLSAADAAFARAWSRYRPIASFDGLMVYRRGKAGCMDVWVAADSAPHIATRATPRTDIR